MRHRSWRPLALALGLLAIGSASGLARTPLALAGIGSPAPVLAVDDEYMVDEDATLAIEAPGVLQNDTTIPGGCAGVVDSASLAGQLTLATDGSFEFASAANFHGETAFTYGLMAVGLEGCPGPFDSQATVTLTVEPVNDPPAAVADSFQALAGRTLNVGPPGLLRNDSDIDGDPLTAVKVSNAAHGVVVVAADGSFSYTPDARYLGPDAFSYRTTDGEASSPVRVVTLTITAVPTPTPSPTPSPSPSPPPTPMPTPEPPPSASPSPDATASAEVSASPSSAPSGAGSAQPSTAAPSPSPAPGAVDSEGGISLPVLLVGVLLAALLAFGAAFYVPRWLEARREP